MRRFLLPMCAAAAVALLLQDPATGRRRRSGAPRVARTHLRYAWQERVDDLVIGHELHLYGNGFVRYAQRAGASTPRETTLPSDPELVAEAEREFRKARAATTVQPPCGAPQGGQLQVQLGRRVERFDLSRPELWARYGRLARRLIGRVVGAMPAPLEADCQPLKLRVDPSKVATAPRRPEPLPSRAQEGELLLAYGAAASAADRARRLDALARNRDGDRYFRWALLRRHPESLEARRLLRQHGSALVRGVRSEAEARELLRLLGSLGSAEARYHRAVLERVLWRAEQAAREERAFRLALDQSAAADRGAKELLAFAGAAVDVRRIHPPWGPIRRSFARLFLSWLDLAEEIWAGDPAEAPPLAELLFRRALHYAIQSALSPSLRTTRGGAVAVKRARRLLRTHGPRLLAGREDALPYWARRDLLDVTGLLRRAPQGFDKAWLAGALEDEGVTLCRMIRMRYFDVAERFLERMALQRKAREGALRLAQGRCLREMERLGEARRAFAQAARFGAEGAREARVEVLLDQGDLEGAEREVEAVSPKTAAAWRAVSRLYRLLGRGADAVEAARRAERAATGGAEGATLVALGRALEVAGRPAEAGAAYGRGAALGGADGVVARERWARLELRLGRPEAAFDVAFPLTTAPGILSRVAGHALLGLAAARRGMPELAALQIDRARYHAHTDPRALGRLAELLVEGGRGHAVAAEALEIAMGLRPGWSALYAHLALLHGQLRQLDAALEAITAALQIRGAYPPYRAIEAALVKLTVEGQGAGARALPEWMQALDTSPAPDAGVPREGPRRTARPARDPARPVMDPARPARDPAQPATALARPAIAPARPLRGSARPSRDPARPVTSPRGSVRPP